MNLLLFYHCVLAFNSVVFFSHYPNIITSVHMFRFYQSKIMTVMFLRCHYHIKWQGQAVVWCHPIIWWQFEIRIDNWTWWIIVHVLVGDLTGFLPLFLTFFFCLFLFFAIFSLCVRMIFSCLISSGVSREYKIFLVPFSSFYFLTYKSHVEVKLFLGWSFLPSCWISRTSWWET